MFWGYRQRSVNGALAAARPRGSRRDVSSALDSIHQPTNRNDLSVSCCACQRSSRAQLTHRCRWTHWRHGSLPQWAGKQCPVRVSAKTARNPPSDTLIFSDESRAGSQRETSGVRGVGVGWQRKRPSLWLALFHAGSGAGHRSHYSRGRHVQNVFLAAVFVSVTTERLEGQKIKR